MHHLAHVLLTWFSSMQEKDVRRTFPHYHFFNGEVERKKHYKAIKRILFIYAKLNPGIGYVQGLFPSIMLNRFNSYILCMR